ncbi:MAG: Ribosomal large subunit pseudouridine synthase D [Chlamydiia bacterium]|nr:Ribosomal large subunit pseudouridine synthase D [Chlamydiia bacterium]MCH9616698.1 Ribosomal large subunit pseudouridine synthase D [Chlamydiia bacterium]MCH9629429.1 Ribosomal large subunit pseudouridine synthase D [Chlamydiia bacterium]
MIVEENLAGIRLDKLLLKAYPEYSRTYFQFLIEQGAVLVNGKRQKKRYLSELCDEIEVHFIATPELSLEPENIPLDIIYEDDDILAINKPTGMVVHPAPGHPNGTLVNALLYHCSLSPDPLRPGIVHRLDKDTSGVILAAKNEKAHRGLIEQFADRKVEKTYLALTQGVPGNRMIDAPIKRHPVYRQKMRIDSLGRPSQTVIETVDSHAATALIKAKPITGRTHQIRVHLAHLGTPILFDPIYGSTKNPSDRLMLHAAEIKFMHPITQKILELKAPIPDDMSKFIATVTKGPNYERIC